MQTMIAYIFEKRIENIAEFMNSFKRGLYNNSQVNNYPYYTYEMKQLSETKLSVMLRLEMMGHYSISCTYELVPYEDTSAIKYEYDVVKKGAGMNDMMIGKTIAGYINEIRTTARRIEFGCPHLY